MKKTHARTSVGTSSYLARSFCARCSSSRSCLRRPLTRMLQIRGQLRREVVHRLATGATQPSELEVCVNLCERRWLREIGGARFSDQKDVAVPVLSRVIAEVADRDVSGKLELRDACWDEFDPHHWHTLRSDVERVQEQAAATRVQMKQRQSIPFVHPPLPSHPLWALGRGRTGRAGAV